MRALYLLPATIVGIVLASAPPADSPPDPLRLIPDDADVFVKVDRPTALAETVLGLDLVQQLQTLEPVRELYSSAGFRRFQQVIAYFEKEMAGQWPDLLDRVAGGAIVVSTRLGEQPAPVLVVVQSKDQRALVRFVMAAQKLIEQELSRSGSLAKIEKGTYRNVPTMVIGKDVHAAVAGSALVISNNETRFRQALDLHIDGDMGSLLRHAGVAEARRLLEANAFAWAWMNLETLRKQPGAQAVLEGGAAEPALTVLFGGWLDQLRRAPFLAACLAPKNDGLQFVLQTSRGREGMPEALALLQLPPVDGPGLPPLLEPRGVMFSMGFTLDLHHFWEQRSKLFNAEQVQALDEFDRTAGKTIGGNRPSWLFKAAGPYHRFVVAHQSGPGYQTKPAQKLPAFAVVLGMRNPKDFSDVMEAVLRTAALTGLGEIKLLPVDEKHGGLTISGYRFPEDRPAAADPAGLRYNFAPCFVAIGDHFVISSSFELARELIDILQKEARLPKSTDQAALRMRLYPAGAADYLQSVEDQLLAQTILDLAVDPKEAREEVRRLIDFVRNAGTLEIEQQYGPRNARYEVRYVPVKR